MPRIQIELPDAFPFSTELTLYLSHMNAAGHLDNALLLTLVSEARCRFFASMGHKELDVDGRGVIVSDAALQYLSEAFHGETVIVEIAPQDFNKYGCDLMWRMRERDRGREIARGKTGIVFFDYQARRIAPVPEVFRQRFVDAA